MYGDRLNKISYGRFFSYYGFPFKRYLGRRFLVDQITLEKEAIYILYYLCSRMLDD
ncbi:hypothetical protein MTsPCn5_37470 [Croceitalea sp. MTPC5]|nr:hypothetical protein MTsPCn5_37470 [Croceitalea sp. MTPC5]